MSSSKTKRLAFFVDSMAGGGAERVMLNLANEYSHRGYDVDLILAKNQGEYLTDVSRDIDIIDLKADGFWQYFRPLSAYVKDKNPDVVLSATSIINLIGN